MRLKRRFLLGFGGLVGLAAVALLVWVVAIGPTAVWRVLTNGTTTVWDHLAYPGRATHPSPTPRSWQSDLGDEPVVTVEGVTAPLGAVLADRDALAMIVLHNGTIAFEWYAPGHGVATPSMLFSVSKSITSLMIGAAIEDGLIGSVDEPVTMYIPELAVGGFDAVTIEDLLQMRSNSTYVENDNPFGAHVEFNYTDDLESDILGLRVRDAPDSNFTYRSGDNAILGLILDRVVSPDSITSYLQHRFLDPLGTESAGIWSTDATDGLERTWCCLALTARDLSVFGQLVLDGGRAGDQQIVSQDWLSRSFAPAYESNAWPDEYNATALSNYGYQWWSTRTGSSVAIGKDGQYLFIDPSRNLVIVRTGTSQGGIGWVDLLVELAGTFPVTGG